MTNIQKVGRKIGKFASKAGRTLGNVYKVGRKKLDDIENTPILGDAVKELEKRTGADRIIQAGDRISDAIS